MGKGGELAVSGKEQEIEKKEVLIDGMYYDVSKMKHPGGSVINFYAGNGIDASAAFHSFHLRSKKAKKVLELLPFRAADENILAKNRLPGQKELLEDFEELGRAFEAEGLFKADPVHILRRTVEIVLMFAAGFWLVNNNQTLAGIVAFGLAQGRCGYLVHEAAHNSLLGISISSSHQ